MHRLYVKPDVHLYININTGGCLNFDIWESGTSPSAVTEEQLYSV